MFTTDSALEECAELWKNCTEYIQVFLQGAPVKNRDLTLASESKITLSNNAIYLIKQGILNESYHQHIIVHYEEGDLVGADALFQNKRTELSTDYSIVVDEYNGVELIEYIRAEPARNRAWTLFLNSLIQSFTILIAHHKQEDIQFHPEVRNYEKGDIIIQQGAQGDEVFTLISGNAQAFVDDTLVGEIKCDEIFGAIAALTDTPRTATIIAESQCTVLAVPNSRFKDLLASRPDTVTNLIQDMARAIVSSNEKIIDLSS